MAVSGLEATICGSAAALPEFLGHPGDMTNRLQLPPRRAHREASTADRPRVRLREEPPGQQGVAVDAG